MIDVLFYSCAGKKNNDVINGLLTELSQLNYINPVDKKLIKHTLEVAEHGNYPDKVYYDTFYNHPELTYKSLAEISNYVGKVKDFYKRQSLIQGVIGATNESNTSKELIEKVSSVLVEMDSSSDGELDEYKPQTYSQIIKKPYADGYFLGVPEIDQLTSGFQPGTVGCIAAFVAEGKSTTAISFMFKNALAKKYCVLFSLEMSPEILWMQLQARYLFEVKGVDISAQDLIFKKLTEENTKLIEKYDKDFREEVGKYIMIVDEAVLSKAIIGDAKLLGRLFKKIQVELGGLDITVWDHVGQLELMYPDMGNAAVRNITSATKTYLNQDGIRLFSFLAVQTNREGKKRATRRDGIYDLMAISDLNEVERSCTYCIFMFTSDESKIVQETKMSMLKHRLGSVLPDPATVTFNPSIITVGTTLEKISASAEDLEIAFSSDFDDPF